MFLQSYLKIVFSVNWFLFLFLFLQCLSLQWASWARTVSLPPDSGAGDSGGVPMEQQWFKTGHFLQPGEGKDMGKWKPVILVVAVVIP